MKIGLYFGSFNPIHVGHLITANTIVQSAELDQVWFVVSPHNPHKKKSSLLHEFDRYDMVRLAIADNEKLSVSDIEFNLPKPSYTIDTLTYIQEKYPNYEFQILIGEDNLTHFHKWKNHEQILEYYGVLVYPREGTIKTEFHDHPKVKFVEAPLLNISATYIRTLIKEKKSIRYLVSQDVEVLIRSKKFYL
ncbi:nicotinate (nicotinamide) nucleotide adenylyltransferase [Bernardetia sp. OM2101]|uniref:nicotinate (nicotinamide) nucleotide adenylyltransferase n=1 Tax=Bernardetia sp. OM2101 TaxID=3344876 RepID=UPI0035CE9EA9